MNNNTAQPTAAVRASMPASQAIFSLVTYGIHQHLIEESDAVYTSNLLFDTMQLPPAAFCPVPSDQIPALEEMLRSLLDSAVERGIIEDGTASRDLFDTKLMGLLTPRPSEVIREFQRRMAESPEAATDYFYALAQDSNYIRRYRIRKDKKWKVSTKYGELDITINLSKPEKDPRAIAAALTQAQSDYPKCLLCRENEGYAGRMTHPARQNIRLIPLQLNGKPWFLQYSPYVYYNEHCIVLSAAHEPMKIDRASFRSLLDFTALFPHYTIGSNADLPIVGGSILTHEHFQGGRYTFAMETADIRETIRFSGYEDILAGIVNWPLSVIRLCGSSPERLTELADRILSCWRSYSDASAEILSHGDTPADAAALTGAPHNTITPIARRKNEKYELDLVLRNNRTTEAFPLGIFHPHQELHHIKKENIGLIEVMGLAVLPARLLQEMETLKDAILSGVSLSDCTAPDGSEKTPTSDSISAAVCAAACDPALLSHAIWAEQLLRKYPEYLPENIKKTQPSRTALDHIIEEEIGLVFSQVLEHCGVFKDSDAGRTQFSRFVAAVNA